MLTQNGLTLLELIIGLMLAGVLLTVGAPGLHQVILDARMTAQVNRFVRGIHLAKQTALTSTEEVVICKSRSGNQCEHDQRWDAGWLIFANSDRDQPPQVDANEARLLVGPAFTDGRISSNRRLFVFRPFQIRSTNGTVNFCDRRGVSDVRRVIISYTGRPRIATSRDAIPDSKICDG
jgi:type IV fimbrial biogenesis protein FimT